MEIVLANFFETEPVAVQEAVTEEKTSNPILPTANEMFWGGLTFVLLWALMKWVLLPPITRLDERARCQGPGRPRSGRLDQRPS